MVLVTVKSADTADMADIIAQHAPPDAVIVSLQNGVGNVAVLRDRLPGRRVLGGMVPFNVIRARRGAVSSRHLGRHRDRAGRCRHRGAAFGAGPEDARRPTTSHGVQWGKLLVNLNNALNALADLPLRRQLAQRPWRRLFADQMAEGLAAIRAEGIRPVSPTPIPASWMPPLLRLPDADLRSLAGADDEDRSRGALVDVGRSAARPPHRDRLSAGRHHRNRRPARAGGAAVAPDRGADPAGRASTAKGSPGLTPEQIRAAN